MMPFQKGRECQIYTSDAGFDVLSQKKDGWSWSMPVNSGEAREFLTDIGYRYIRMEEGNQVWAPQVSK
jgi:hypothetical protein